MLNPKMPCCAFIISNECLEFMRNETILFLGINGLIDALSVQLKFLIKKIAHMLHAKTVPSRHICYIH